MPSKSHPVNQNANIAVNESDRNRWNIATARVTKFTNNTVFICERRSQLSRVIVLIVANLGIWPKRAIQFVVVCEIQSVIVLCLELIANIRPRSC